MKYHKFESVQDHAQHIFEIIIDGLKSERKPMKVIIELSNNVFLESTENENEVYIMVQAEGTSISSAVNIDDLKVALKKMTAK